MSHYAARLYRGYDVLAFASFRITRNSNLYLQEEEARNLLEQAPQVLTPPPAVTAAAPPPPPPGHRTEVQTPAPNTPPPVAQPPRRQPATQKTAPAQKTRTTMRWMAGAGLMLVLALAVDNPPGIGQFRGGGGGFRGGGGGGFRAGGASMARPVAAGQTFNIGAVHGPYGGTVGAVSGYERQAMRMTDSLFYRIAEAAGRDAEEVREDARRGRAFTVAEAIGYGLIHERAARRPS